MLYSNSACPNDGASVLYRSVNPREPHLSVLREKILNVAADLFQTRGINSTGVDTIVAEAGTTKMTLYKHFQTKENLILEVLKRHNQEFRDWLAAKLGETPRTPDKKLQALFDYIEEWMNAPEFRGMPFLKASAEFPNEENPVHRLSTEQARQFRQYLASLAEEAGAHEPQTLALQLSMLIEGAMLSEQMRRGSGAAAHAKKAARLLIEAALKR
jgi:AcrR family transcriptional regulator